MTFEHRVVRRRHKNDPEFLARLREKYPNYPEYAEHLAILEVYYVNGTPKGTYPEAKHVNMWQAEAQGLMGGESDVDGKPFNEAEALAEMRATVDLMARALKKPILNEWDFQTYEGD